MLDAPVASAARHSRRSIVLSRFYRGELAELRRVSIGPDLVFGRLWRETGCAEVIRALLVGRRFGFDVERAIYLTVLHRLMVSGSDRHASRWHHGFRIPGAEELTLDHAYRAMIWLGEEIADGRTTTDAIEEDLYRHRQELFGEVSIAFFDTLAQPLDDRHEPRHVGGVAGPQEGGERPIIAVENHAEHHLLKVRTIVLAVAELAQRLSAGALEVQRCRVLASPRCASSPTVA